jgi:catechol 2,3-dioxygenase-like lactoylglutathione lyase family enzyme
MFSHIMVGANDLQIAKLFYDATLGKLGVRPGRADLEGRIFYITETGMFVLTKPLNGKLASGANGGTIGFSASSAQTVVDWHAAGISCGGTHCEDGPGVRQVGKNRLFLAYLRDPSGNKLCAMHRIAS